MRHRLIAACMALALLGAAQAQGTPGIQITPAGSTPARIGSAEHFSGQAAVDMKAAGGSGSQGSVGMVDFMPGARTAWHTHPAGQLLIVTEGRGWVQEDGGPRREIRAGDVVWIEAGVKHWHGAAKDQRMSHLAIASVRDGRSVDWQELVSDAQYAATGPSAAAPAADTLTPRQQAILPVAAFAAAGDMPGLGRALHHGLDAGMTISDAREVLVQLYAYAGFPRSLNALNALMQVLDARRQRGIQDAPGREPSRAIAQGDALRAAGAATQTRLVGRPVAGPVYDFAPVMSEYLQTHLFGTIFERDNLDWQSRELATVAMLSAIPGAEAQLQSHLRVSLNVGLGARQMRHAVQVLDERVGAENGQRAREALARVLAP